MIHNFLFPTYHNLWLSLLLLAGRIVFGGMFLTHGLQKLANFKAMSANFPSIMGMGNTLSLSLAIFAEVFCTLGFITGFLYRLSMIPMIFTMIVAQIIKNKRKKKKENTFILTVQYLEKYHNTKQ